MGSFQENKGLKNIVYSWPVLIFLFIILLFFAWGVIRFTVKMLETAKNRKIAEIKTLNLTQAKIKLTNDIENLKTEKGIEENIREKFGLAKEGEGLIVVVDEKKVGIVEDKEKQNWFTSLFKKWVK